MCILVSKEYGFILAKDLKNKIIHIIDVLKKFQNKRVKFSNNKIILSKLACNIYYLVLLSMYTKRYRLVVRTGDSHSPNRGSIPLTAGYFLCIKSNQKHFRHIGL